MRRVHFIAPTSDGLVVCYCSVGFVIWCKDGRDEFLENGPHWNHVLGPSVVVEFWIRDVGWGKAAGSKVGWDVRVGEVEILIG